MSMATNIINMALETNGHDMERRGGEEYALAPLADRIARGIASGLVMAMKELENHIASETRKVSDTVGRRIDALQNALKEAETRHQTDISTIRNEAAVTTSSLRETDAKHEAALASARQETSERINAITKELSLHHEDITAIKSTLNAFNTTVEGLVQRLDRQADALRSLSASYAQRETELATLVEGLARMRAYPAPAPAATDRL
jgi:chromosome segregation ATPase